MTFARRKEKYYIFPTFRDMQTSCTTGASSTCFSLTPLVCFSTTKTPEVCVIDVAIDASATRRKKPVLKMFLPSLSHRLSALSSSSTVGVMLGRMLWYSDDMLTHHAETLRFILCLRRRKVSKSIAHMFGLKWRFSIGCRVSIGIIKFSNKCGAEG